MKTIFAASCATNTCHNGGNNPHLNYSNVAGLYALLTSPIAAQANRECIGTTPVVAGDVNGSLLANIVKGNTTCKNNGNNQNIVRMPDDCSATGNTPRPCLTADKIKTITDWIAAGAKND